MAAVFEKNKDQIKRFYDFSVFAGWTLESFGDVFDELLVIFAREGMRHCLLVFFVGWELVFVGGEFMEKYFKVAFGHFVFSF